jgi:hypothetical protein
VSAGGKKNRRTCALLSLCGPLESIGVDVASLKGWRDVVIDDGLLIVAF